MKVITIPLSHRPEAAVTLKLGLEMSQKFGANVVGYHIRPHGDSDKTINIDENNTLSNDESDSEWLEALKTKSDESNIKAVDLFNTILDDFDKSLDKPRITKAIWQERVGSPSHLFSIVGPISDLILISRPKKKRGLADQFMTAALFKSSSPLLVLPQTSVKTIGQKVAIAWNQSHQAANAVKAALPLLSHAKEVNILSYQSQNKLGPKVSHLQKYLKLWGIKSNHVITKGEKDTDAILNGYHQTNSDLLVMGGYSHSRLKESLFGGMTEFMLYHNDIPVFIMHT